MKSSPSFFSVSILALVFMVTLAVATAYAASKPSTPPPPVDPRILVKSVDPTSFTIVIQYMRDKTLHTYTVDDLTALKVNNSSAKFTDIKPGMQVRDYVERDPRTLDTLTVDFADPGPVVPVKTAKPAKPATPPKQ